MNWVSFLEQQHIEFVDRGPSTSKDNIYVACPFCGGADHGHHMGISLKGSGWGCWRNTSHRGRNPARLVQALIRCSWDEANRIAGRGGRVVSGLREVLNRLSKSGRLVEAPKVLTMPGHFRPLDQELSPHWKYFLSRAFKGWEIYKLVEKFDLRMVWGGYGLWSWRIVIPVYDEDGELVTWTARSIGDMTLRYRTLTADPEKGEKDQVAIHPISDCLLGAERLFQRGKVLVVVEGPFDCMRLALEEDHYNCRVTCLFGKGVSAAQRDMLIRLRPLYDKVYILLDPDASLDSLRLLSDLRAVDVALFRLQEADDPGELTTMEVREIFEQMLDRVSDN